MALVEGADRVLGEMAFKVFQAGEQLFVEGQAQAVDDLQVTVTGRRLARFDPLDAIAAHAFLDLQVLPAADPGGHQQAFAGTTMALRSQLAGQMVRQEDFLLRPAVFGKVIDDSNQQRVVGLNEHARFYSRPHMPRQDLTLRGK